MAQRIGILPGVFDPIHRGHIALARAAHSQLHLDEVWLLIDADPVHKQLLAPFADRIAMARLATADYPHVFADRSPIQRRADRRTLATAHELHLEHPGSEFVMIMGADAFCAIDRWEGVTELLKLVSFGVSTRREVGLEAIGALRQRLGEQANELSYKSIVLEPHAFSSSMIREQLAQGEAPQGLDLGVAAYIHQHELYGTHAKLAP